MNSLRSSIALVAVASVAVLALALAGCGSSSDETSDSTATPSPASTAPSPPPASSSGAPSGVRAKVCGSASGAGNVRVTGVGCAEGRKVVSAWVDSENCTMPAGASRGSCRVHGRVCLSAVTDRGITVTCAGPGKSVAFIARPRR